MVWWYWDVFENNIVFLGEVKGKAGIPRSSFQHKRDLFAPEGQRARPKRQKQENRNGEGKRNRREGVYSIANGSF